MSVVGHTSGEYEVTLPKGSVETYRQMVRRIAREKRRQLSPNKAICNAMAARALAWPAFMFQGGEERAAASARLRRNKQKALRKKRRTGLAGAPRLGVSTTFTP